jgi:CRP/FNR family transcriptional regulator, cyclic AMP receptor protein
MSEVNKDKYLRSVDIFKDLTEDEIHQLGKRAPMKRVPGGTIFYTPEQNTEVLFILKEGRVRLYHLGIDGRMLTLATLEEGAIFGEMTLLGQKLQSNFAEAVEPCLLCLMSREDVKSLLLSDPRIAFRLTEMMGQRLVDIEQRLSDMAFKHVPERIATQLIQLAQQRRSWLGGKACPEARCTHEELAHLVGVHRETVTKVLNEFRQQGLIHLARGRVKILNVSGLHAIRKTAE